MNIFNRKDNDFSIEEIEKAEILEAYTRKLRGERLSRFQSKLLKNDRYAKELETLKHLIEYTHHNAEREEFTEIVVPRHGAAQRVRTKILELISDARKISRGRVWQMRLPAAEPAPISPDPVGSDSALEVTVYDESIDTSLSNATILKFRIIEGDEKDREYSLTLPEELMTDNGNQANVKLQRSITIGRGNSAELQLSDSSNKMSRVHAKLDARDGSVYITDLNSTNGTYINSVRITDSAKLSPGSTVKMGGVIIQIISIDNVS